MCNVCEVNTMSMILLVFCFANICSSTCTIYLYAPGLLLGNNILLFLHKIFFKVFPRCKNDFLTNFLKLLEFGTDNGNLTMLLFLFSFSVVDLFVVIVYGIEMFF